MKQDVVPVRHYGRGALTVVVVLLFGGVTYGFATNPNFDWSVVGKYLLSPAILSGLGSTLSMTVIAMIIAVVLAVVMASMRISTSRVISSIAWLYIFIFRGVPLIVLLIFVGNLGLFIREIVIGIPLTDIVLVQLEVGEVVTPFIASIIGLSITGSAYMAEIVRAGMLSVGHGQREAAKALGVTSFGTLRYIVLPQALRVIIPPMGNEFVGMLKASAIVSVIAGGDLLTVALGISGVTYRTIELLIVATIWYLSVIVVFSIGQYFLEKRAAAK